MEGIIGQQENRKVEQEKQTKAENIKRQKAACFSLRPFPGK